MTLEEFQEHTRKELEALFGKARDCDELSYLFAILGIDSGMEDLGWQPIGETHQLAQDLIGLIHSPLNDYAKTRMALFLYCHITEANFLYHTIYNMLLTIAGRSPNVFNFLDKYKNGVPPSVNAKISEIDTLAAEVGRGGITEIFGEIFKPEIRNAFFHSDYILFNGALRLKHRGSQYQEIPIQDAFILVEKTLYFFNAFFDLLDEGRRSFPVGYRITGRKNSDGMNLSSIDVSVDEESGVVTGFSSSDPLPLW